MALRDEQLFRSKRELLAATKALEEMRSAPSFDEFAIAWQTFLDGLEKVWVKAKRECQPFRNKFEPWQGAFKKVRKEDELLVYLRQARHADQHTIEPTMIEFLGGFQLTLPPGGSVNVRLNEQTGEVTIDGP